MKEYDIAIIGSGLVGSSLAHGLKHLHKKIVLVDAKLLSALDDSKSRPISLNHNSVEIFKKLQLWDTLKPHATPIETVHISEKGAFNAVRIRANDYQLEALGYVVPLHHLYNNLIANLHQQNNVTLKTPLSVTALKYIENGLELRLNNDDIIEANLVVAADGAQSTIRDLLNIQTETRPNQEHVIVASLTATHHNTAYERFTQDGIIALLPQPNHRCNLVWTTSQPQRWLSLSDQEFLDCLQQNIGYKLGKLSNLSQRFSQPLEFNVAKEQVRPHCVLLGNAAHTFYPIAAQGFNLSLADMAALVDIIETERSLNDYVTSRQHPQQLTTVFTHSLADIFASKLLPMKICRRSALALLTKIPALKDHLAHFAMGNTQNTQPIPKALMTSAS